MNENNFGLLAYIANISQLMDLGLNLSQTSNDELMKHLQKQEYVLDQQTNDYLKKIIENQEEIIRLLNEVLPKRLGGRLQICINWFDSNALLHNFI